MSEGRIAKSTPQPEVAVVLTPTITNTTFHQPEVPIDVLRFFNLDFNVDGKITDKLKDISSWAFSGVETSGDGLMKLKKLEMSLGAPRSDETRLDKVWRWVKMERAIDEMRKKQEALR